TPEVLTADELDRMPAAPSVWTYRAEDGADDMVLVLSSGEPDFAANIDVVANVSNNTMLWRARVSCTPVAAVPDRLLIHLSDAAGGIPSFALNEPQADLLMPRRLSRGEEERLGFPGGGETWEMTSFRSPNE